MQLSSDTVCRTFKIFVQLWFFKAPQQFTKIFSFEFFLCYQMHQWFKIQQIDPEQFQQIFNKFAMIFKKTTFMLIKCDSKRTLVKIGKKQIC